MTDYVVFQEECLHKFYDPNTCSYIVPAGGKVGTEIGELRGENSRLRLENTKLRVMVLEMLHNMNGCSQGSSYSCGLCNLEECPYEAEARELGIGVDK